MPAGALRSGPDRTQCIGNETPRGCPDAFVLARTRRSTRAGIPERALTDQGLRSLPVNMPTRHATKARLNHADRRVAKLRRQAAYSSAVNCATHDSNCRNSSPASDLFRGRSTLSGSCGTPFTVYAGACAAGATGAGADAGIGTRATACVESLLRSDTSGSPLRDRVTTTKQACSTAVGHGP